MPRPRCLLFLALLGALLLSGPSSQAQDTPPLQGLTPAERDLLLSATEIFDLSGFQPGVIAPGLPFEVAPLADRTVVGSILQLSGPRVVVRTSLSADVARRVILGLLKKDGWVDQFRTGLSADVFQDAPSDAPQYSPLCKPGVPGQLDINIFPNGTGRTQVNYSFSRFAVTRCPEQPVREAGITNAYATDHGDFEDPLAALRSSGVVLPALPAPAGAFLSPDGTEYSPTSYKTYARVYSARKAEQVRAAYLGQLNAQGWVTTGSKRNGAELVSTVRRTFGKRTLDATFALTPRPGQTRTNDTQVLQAYDLKFEFTY